MQTQYKELHATMYDVVFIKKSVMIKTSLRGV